MHKQPLVERRSEEREKERGRERSISCSAVIFLRVLEWVAGGPELFWRLEDERGVGEVVSQPATLLHVRRKDGCPTQARLILNERNSDILIVCTCICEASVYVSM